MAKLSDSQRVVLSTACQRPDGCVFPVTLKLKGNAVGNVLKSLLTKGYLEEVPGRADDTVWRYDDGAPLTLKASRTAYDELGIGEGRGIADTAVKTGKRASRAKAEKKPAPTKRNRAKPQAEPKAPRTRGDSKQAKLIEMLKRPEGASIEEIVAAFDWQAHTVRGAIAGALKKRLGLDVTSEKIDGRGRVYRIA
jgi:hypothetical protein